MPGWRCTGTPPSLRQPSRRSCPPARCGRRTRSSPAGCCISLPLVLLIAMAGGYVLARRALAPVRELSTRAAAIDPEALHARLPVRRPADEIDALADQFNQLLERLERSQATNRSFLARAAHQLKTPLTVVRGESTLGLERPRSVDGARGHPAADRALRRPDVPTGGRIAPAGPGHGRRPAAPGGRRGTRRAGLAMRRPDALPGPGHAPSARPGRRGARCQHRGATRICCARPASNWWRTPAGTRPPTPRSASRRRGGGRHGVSHGDERRSPPIYPRRAAQQPGRARGGRTGPDDRRMDRGRPRRDARHRRAGWRERVRDPAAERPRQPEPGERSADGLALLSVTAAGAGSRSLLPEAWDAALRGRGRGAVRGGQVSRAASGGLRLAGQVPNPSLLLSSTGAAPRAHVILDQPLSWMVTRGAGPERRPRGARRGAGRFHRDHRPAGGGGAPRVLRPPGARRPAPPARAISRPWPTRWCRIARRRYEAGDISQFELEQVELESRLQAQLLAAEEVEVDVARWPDSPA